MTSSQYRYDTVKEFQHKLQTLIEQYSVKKKKYQRRISIIDVAVYSASGVIAGAGIILSSVTMVAPIVVPICISAAATVTGIFTGITKKKYHRVLNENFTITRLNLLPHQTRTRNCRC